MPPEPVRGAGRCGRVVPGREHFPEAAAALSRGAGRCGRVVSGGVAVWTRAEALRREGRDAA